MNSPHFESTIPLEPWYELQNHQTYAELMLANPVVQVPDKKLGGYKEFRYILEPY